MSVFFHLKKIFGILFNVFFRSFIVVVDDDDVVFVTLLLLLML